MLYVLLGLGLFLAGISGRVTTLAVRSGIERPLNAAHALRDAVGTVAGLCFWALAIWGFSSLTWYLVAAEMLGLGAIAGLAANPPRFGFFYKAEPVCDVAVVCITGFLWIAYWPY